MFPCEHSHHVFHVSNLSLIWVNLLWRRKYEHWQILLQAVVLCKNIKLCIGYYWHVKLSSLSVQLPIWSFQFGLFCLLFWHYVSSHTFYMYEINIQILLIYYINYYIKLQINNTSKYKFSINKKKLECPGSRGN